MPKESKHYRFRRIEFWAQGGMITLVDENVAGDSSRPAADAVRRISPREMLERAVAIRMGTPDYADEVFEVRQFLERAVEVIKIARAQGDPTDPKVLSTVARHQRRGQILMPGNFSSPLPQRVDRQAVEGSNVRETLLEGKGVQTKPDLTIGPRQMLTPARANRRRRRR